MTDFYKTTHLLQFAPEITHLTSYLTPRSSRFNSIDKMVWFGVQAFCQKYLVENFTENFFYRDWFDIEEEITHVLRNGLEYNEELIDKTVDKVLKLWSLGYLPIEINALPEGTLVPMGVPALEIRTTEDGFAWVGQAIESLLSCSIWHPCVSATIAYEYAKIAKAAYQDTVDDNISWKTAMCDFSMRGQESYESAVASSAAWLTSFYSSSTVDARGYIEEYYWDKEIVPVYGLTSTEHSVMTSDFAINGNERETYRRLLTEVYPNINFAVVADSYDFWNILTEVLPSLRDEIEAHNGFLGVRHDSSEPVQALCGIKTVNLNQYYGGTVESFDSIEDREDREYAFADFVFTTINEFPENFNSEKVIYFEYTTADNTKYSGVYQLMYIPEEHHYCIEKLRDEMTWADKGMVQTIYELFGGTTNSKGYKVVNPKLKAVYGDSITIPRAKEIYRRLKEKGFAANNVSLGVGSFSMECIEEEGEDRVVLKPFTRDSFSIAIKATYGRINKDGEEKEIQIYKDPKGFSQKKSLRGLCVPYLNENGEIVVKQCLNEEERTMMKDKSLFVPYFSKKLNFYNFKDIRDRIDENLKEGR
jgi:nicotinamide phosphoribosyltransferase